MAEAIEETRQAISENQSNEEAEEAKEQKKMEESPSVAVLAARESALAELGSRNSNIGDSIISNNSCISNGRYRGEGRNRKNGT